jgi:hypothetical protein
VLYRESLAVTYVYYEEEAGRRKVANLKTKDEARADSGQYRKAAGAVGAGVITAACMGSLPCRGEPCWGIVKCHCPASIAQAACRQANHPSLRHRSVASACADFERSIAGLPHVTLTTKLPGLTAS